MLKTKRAPVLSAALSLMSLFAIGTACSTASKPNSSNTPPLPIRALDPGELVRVKFEPGELTRLCTLSMDKASARLDKVAKLPKSERTLENTLIEFEAALADLDDETSSLTFMGYVAPDKQIHDEGTQCEETLEKYSVGVFTRKDLYEAVKDAPVSGDAEKRLLYRTRQSFERNGLMLSDDKLAKAKELNTKLAELETKFTANLNNDTTTVEFTGEELAGVPDTFLARLKKTADGKRYVVTTKASDWTIVLDNARLSETRRKMATACDNIQAGPNTKLLEEAIQVRRELAGVLGYKTWADYQTAVRMAKTGETALDFLNSLRGKLAKRNEKDLAQLLKFKKELDPSATHLDAWDTRYLTYQLKKRDYQIDDEKIREYFPADEVMKGMFKVYSKLLGVSFAEVPGAKTWADGVKLYEIRNAKGGELLAYFYADLYPRERKYEHFAAFALVTGRQKKDGYQKPIAAIVGNFNPPANGRPSLLNHSDVKTMFHEFGHIMHKTLTRVPYARLSGTAVARDFVEAPSQMLENWTWQPEVLSQISAHYTDHSKKLPKKMIQQMIRAKDFNQGVFYTRQLQYALMDLTFHTTDGPVDTSAIYRKLYKELVTIEPLENSHQPASFGHLMGGYDAGYYGYLWSEVYAMDMFTRFEKGKFLSPKVGADYRKYILERGDLEDAIVLVEKFLKRKSNPQAFYRMLHIQ